MKKKEKKAFWLLPSRYAAPASLEEFLEKLAAEGWNVERIRQWDSMRMVFYKTEPRRYRYVVDLNPFPKKDYRATYEAFGWELVGKMASMFIWRKAYSGERPEAFTDRQSMEKRSMNFVTVMIWLIVAMSAVLGVLTAVFCASGGANDPQAVLGFAIAAAILLALIVWIGITARTIYKKRNQ